MNPKEKAYKHIKDSIFLDPDEGTEVVCECDAREAIDIALEEQKKEEFINDLIKETAINCSKREQARWDWLKEKLNETPSAKYCPESQKGSFWLHTSSQ